MDGPSEKSKTTDETCYMIPITSIQQLKLRNLVHAGANLCHFRDNFIVVIAFVNFFQKNS